MKILITGKASYIGMCFEAYLAKLDCGYIVDAIDVSDETWRETSFEGYDTILHLSAIVHKKEKRVNKDLYQLINCDLAVEIAQKAKQEGVKQFIFLSSMSVYGMTTGTIDIDTIPMPNSLYGESKLLAEQLLRSIESDTFKVAVLRPPMVYGKGCKGNYNLLAKWARKITLFPGIENQRSMIYIENLCHFIFLIVKEQDRGIFFPQNSEYVSTVDMVKKIGIVHNKKICIEKLSALIIRKFINSEGIFSKVFGNLIYNQQISIYKNYNYNIIDFMESIRRSEDF